MKRFSALSFAVVAIVGCSQQVMNIPDMVEIPAGEFRMGSENPCAADYDEAPAHDVVMAGAFFMSKTEITNAQYEEFCPEHKELRDEFSANDNDAVVNVTWFDACDYCAWLTKKTGRSFRLPTEAEWEYACRADSYTLYNIGDTLSTSMLKHQQTERNLVPVSLEVGQSEPNAWGLYDMHGNVEEWCFDWYGSYSSEKQVDPCGASAGIYKVTRGGSHNTPVEFLRSASRSAATPDDAHNQIGFRVVESDPIELPEVEAFYTTHAIEKYVWGETDESEPIWMEPIPFVIAPIDGTPFYRHNHQPAVAWCDNGDLLAIWFTCEAESGREMEVLSSRLHPGAKEWEPAQRFFKVPDRNMTGNSLLRLSDGTLLHMNGVGNSGDWQNLALCARRSTDNGYSWSAPVLVEPKHVVRHQVISGPIILSDGTLVQLCDAGADGDAGTSIHLSMDGGYTWEDQWDGSDFVYGDGVTGSTIAGIHATVVELKDGSLMAFGRSNSINGKMPRSVSRDRGKTWTYSATEFPPVGSGQRHVLMRLQEGPLMLASFGEHGLFVCVSEDEGESWSEPRLMTDGKTRVLDGGAHTKVFTMTADQAEPKGYMTCVQTPDGMIHLLSSRLHYRFNLKWIKD